MTHDQAISPENLERLKSNARKGGLVAAANRRETKKLQVMTARILNTSIPMTGNLGDILYKVGIDATKKVSAMEGILGVFTAKALGGDIKAARFILECGGWSLDAQMKKAKVQMLNSMADNPEKVILENTSDRPQPTSNLDEIQAEAERMGLYDNKKQDATDAEIV